MIPDVSTKTPESLDSSEKKFEKKKSPTAVASDIIYNWI
jgi:hypothetical protein